VVVSESELSVSESWVVPDDRSRLVGARMYLSDRGT
jgi:hypothetical protein